MGFDSTRTRLFLGGCILCALPGAFGQTSGSIETMDQSGAAIPGLLSVWSMRKPTRPVRFHE